MKVAITGGTGCLGQPLLNKLINSGIDIQLLVLPHDQAKNSLSKKIRIIYGDLSSFDALKSLTRECEIVFHLAGKVHSIPKSKYEEQEFFRVNVEGTRNLLRVSKFNKVKRVIFYSTVGVYGKDANFHGDELSQCRPVYVYAKTKYLSEQLVLNAYKNGGPSGTVFRFPVVYGPLDRGNVARLINAVKKKRIVYFGSADYLRSMISSVNTAEAAYISAINSKAINKLFCVTDGVDYTINQLIETICKGLEMSWRPNRIPLSLGKCMGIIGDIFERISNRTMPINSSRFRKLSTSLTFSCDRIKEQIGYRPVKSFQEGIKDEIRWLRTVEK